MIYFGVTGSTSPPSPLSDAERGNQSKPICSPLCLGEGLGVRLYLTAYTPVLRPVPSVWPPPIAAMLFRIEVSACRLRML